MPCSSSKMEYRLLRTTTVKSVHRIRRLIDLDDNWDVNKTEPSPPYGSDRQDINLPCQDDSSAQGDKSGLNSSQQKPAAAHPCCCCQNKTSVGKSNQNTVLSKEEFAVGRRLEAHLPRFGPSYGEDMEVIKFAKEEAWNNVLTKTIGEEQSEIYLIYNSAIKRIEKEARDAYAPDIVSGMRKSDFRWRMIRDGCFFLQLALNILGGHEQLGYPEKHFFFGIPSDRERSQWIKAMFFIGNQIPCLVIRELMKQSFFQSVIREGIKEQTWRLPWELPMMVLYLLLVVPEVERNGGSSSSGLFCKPLWQKRPPYFGEPPSDILHGMHCLVLGHGNDPLYSEIKEFRDLEAGREDWEIRFPSARELEKSGIKLKKAKEGIMEVHFKSFFYFAHLYVPPLTIRGYTESILQDLTIYERQLDKEDREVTAYLRFMRDLTQTYKDFKILESKGIIQVRDIGSKYNTLNMLNKIVSSQESNFTLNLRQTRREIADYKPPPPWHLLSLALILSVVQTVFTILAYFLPRN